MTPTSRSRTLTLIAVALLAALSLMGSTTSLAGTPDPGPAAALAPALAPDAPPSPLITYQGRLLDPATGDPKPDGSYNVRFALYSVDTGGTALWSESQTVALSKGLFSVTLGNQAGNPLTTTVFDGSARWLGVAIDPDGELLPRIRIAHTPYAIMANQALNATNADNLGGSAAGTYRDATNLIAGNLSTDRYHAIDDLTAEGFLDNAAGDIALNNGALQSSLNADLLDGAHSAAFAPVLHNHDSAYVNVTGDTMTGMLTLFIPAGGSHGVSANTASTLSGAAAVEAKNTGAGFGLNASSANSYGVLATATGSGAAVYGWNTGSAGGSGVLGQSSSSYGIHGISSDSFGVTGSSTNNIGVYGESSSSRGVYGSGVDTGVYGYGQSYGLYGWNTSTVGLSSGVGGYASAASGSTVGVKGQCNSSNASCYAGYFIGRVYVSGDLAVGGVKPFRIDHPLDPANKYLYHFAVESPEVRNLYQGNATLDDRGEAVVTLPAYFDALNAGADFNYQLTCIGGYAPVYIAEKIQGNQFKIGGGKPGLEVSWQVTALRDDPYLRDHPVQAEVAKTGDEKGTLEYPAGYGQPDTLGIDRLAPAAQPIAQPGPAGKEPK